jgi:hypothetical protein
LRFQLLAGSQISTLMSESLLGVSVAETRQNSGRSLYGLPPRGEPAPPGSVNCLAGTVCAAVILPSGKAKAARLSHDAANAGGADRHAIIPMAMVIRGLVIGISRYWRS